MLTITGLPLERLRDLEAEAFRVGCALARHGEQLATLSVCQHTVLGEFESLAERIGRIEKRLVTIERVLFAIARAQGIDPVTVD